MLLEQLKRVLTQTEPAVVLVTPRVMRRILQAEYGVPYLMVHAPHERCYFFDREVLFRHVEQDELDVPPDRLLPATVILLTRPTAEQLEATPDSELLSRYWRLLFHVHVHLALRQRQELGQLTAADVRQRIETIGQIEFEEIRTVLHQEKDLLPHASDTEVYVEFAAVYLELSCFRGNLRSTYFPAIRDFRKIDQLLARDVDAESIFARTRLKDAPSPVVVTDTRSDESDDYFRRLKRNAENALQEGDRVRASILLTKAARVAPVAQASPTRSVALLHLEELVDQLRDALQFAAEEAQQWKQVLPALLDKSDQGTLPIEAKILFDLQEAWYEHNRKTYALDVVEWVLSAGKRPIKRPLTNLQLVRMTKHLRAAHQRLTMARVSDEDRQQLARLLQSAQQLSEDRVRDRFRPILRDALLDVSLTPANIPERVAFEKVIEEMLDRILEYGFFTFSDLRDVLSRNQLKLPDLADPHDYWQGDPLLRLDRRLSALLEGVYRASEFYLRWLESGSSLFGGTGSGRFLTRHVIWPVGGAIVLVKGPEIILNHYLAGDEKSAGGESTRNQSVAQKPDGNAPESRETAGQNQVPVAENGAEKTGGAGSKGAKDAASSTDAKHIANLNQTTTTTAVSVIAKESAPFQIHVPWSVVAVVALFILSIVVIERFRILLASYLRVTYRNMRYLTVELPVEVWNLTLVQRLFKSWPVLLLYWYILKPLAVCGAIWLYWPAAGSSWPWILLTLLVASVLLNSRFGYGLSEGIVEAVVLLYGWLRFEVLRGLFRLVNRFFKQVTWTFEYLLFTVDEWVRSRSDEGTLRMVVRAIMGVLWYPIGYLSRFYYLWLLEPTLNPIKLPFSSLAFKFMLLIPWYQQSMIPGTHTSWLEQYMEWPTAVTLTYVFIIPTLWFVPGMFAFLFWEMSANWRLFRENRSTRLRPVPIGRHGETMLQLLQPGFHSGTVPRLFAHLRRAERAAYHTRDWRPARTYRQSLQEVARCIQVFIERELIALLRHSKTWGNQHVTVAQIIVSCNRIRIELGHADFPAQSVWIAFAEHSGWLLGCMEDVGWLAHLPAEHRQVMTSALAGLYKLAGVDLVREQLSAVLPSATPHYEISDHYLIVRNGQQNGQALAYDLTERRSLLRPIVLGEANGIDGQPLDARRLIFSRVPLSWDQWVECWQKEHEHNEPARLLSESVALWPSVAREPENAAQKVKD